jgi:very-short-patch-repair endonuclease
VPHVIPQARRTKLAKVDPAGGRWPETVAQDDYVANLVSPAELRHVLRARSGRDDLGEPAVAWIAGRQLGLVACWQLQALGVSSSSITRRLRRGALHRVYRGVFLVGHALLVPGARELAAVLACGEGALVSHRSAALLWGLTQVAGAEVEVSVVARNCRPRDGLHVHRLAYLDARDRAVKNGIPTTSPARSLVDLAASAAPDEVEQALAQARARRLVTARQLPDTLGRARNRAGVGTLRAVLRHQGGPRLTRSEAERRLLGLIRAARLPEPESNVRVEGFEVDFLWPEARLIVEVDGFAFHGHRAAFERDRQRDMTLRDRGFEVIRVTWRQLVDQPLVIIAHIARALERAGPRWRYSSSASNP